MSGPSPKPVALKLLEGNRGHQPAKKLKKGPEWDQGFGSCPKHLQGEARKLWKRLVPQLEAKKLSASVYRPTLEGLCLSYARALKAEEVIETKGLTMTFTTDNGSYEQQRPEVAIAAKAWQAVKGFAAEFGLTPALLGECQCQDPSSAALTKSRRSGPRRIEQSGQRRKNLEFLERCRSQGEG